MRRFISLITALLMCICFVPTKAEAMSVSASAAVLINGDNGEVIYSKNSDACLPMASTTKIMTALLLCENGNFNLEITVTKEMLAVEGSSMGLLPGDRVTLHDLLYGMLLASGNDAANVTATVLGGSVDEFVTMMNDKAQALGLSNTHFVTPSGLDAEGHYTTAMELALLAKYAMSNKEFASAAASKSATLNYGNPPYRRTLTNHNRLLKCFDGAVGIKTGFTKKSGRCLVSAARRDGKYVIAVTLHDPNDWADHQILLEYGLSSIIQTQFTPEVTEYKIPVVGGKKNSLTVKIGPFTVNSINNAEISCNINLPPFTYAPVEKGDVIGTAEYYCGGESVASCEITASENIAVKRIKSVKNAVFIKNIKDIISNII